MSAIKCPACGHLISPHSVLADGKVSCPGCKKTYSFRKKASPATPPGSTEASPPAAAVEAPSASEGLASPAAASAPAAAALPRRSKIPPRSFPGVRNAPSKRAPVEGSEAGGESEVAAGVPSAKAGNPAQKKVLAIVLACSIVLVLGVIALFVKLQFGAAAEAQRVAAEQLLQVLALKWSLEGEGVKECEAAWREFRSEANSEYLRKLLSDPPERRDMGLRLWMYEHRSQELRQRISSFLNLLDIESNQLLYLKGHEGQKPIDTEDVALDWLTFRGYQVFEGLKKKGAASAAGGARVDSTTPGGLKMSMFGSTVEFEFNPGPSSIDLNSGVLRAVYQTSYPGPGSLEVLAAIREDRYILSLKAEIQEYLSNAGPWWYGSFESSAGKSAPAAGAGPPPADAR